MADIQHSTTAPARDPATLDFIDAMGAKLRAMKAMAHLACDGAHAHGNQDEARVFDLVAETMRDAMELLEAHFNDGAEGE